MSNLSTCYGKTGQYQESIDLDLKIINSDNKFDKCYARLFNNYSKLGKKEQALYYGEQLLKFDEETLGKYKDIIVEIENLKKTLEDEYNEKKEKEKKEKRQKIVKYVIPLLILIAAGAIYFFVFKKKQIAK